MARVNRLPMYRQAQESPKLGRLVRVRRQRHLVEPVARPTPGRRVECPLHPVPVAEALGDATEPVPTGDVSSTGCWAEGWCPGR